MAHKRVEFFIFSVVQKQREIRLKEKSALKSALQDIDYGYGGIIPLIAARFAVFHYPQCGLQTPARNAWLNCYKGMEQAKSWVIAKKVRNNGYERFWSHRVC